MLVSCRSKYCRRGDVHTGDGVMIGGFIITGTQAKQVIMRVLGPSLGLSGVTGVLTDPVWNYTIRAARSLP
ncbi:MAG: hypothetical protein ABIS71_12970 [Chthoniobacterales bacterium]